MIACFGCDPRNNRSVGIAIEITVASGLTTRVLRESQTKDDSLLTLLLYHLLSAQTSAVPQASLICFPNTLAFTVIKIAD